MYAFAILAGKCVCVCVGVWKRLRRPFEKLSVIQSEQHFLMETNFPISHIVDCVCVCHLMLFIFLFGLPTQSILYMRKIKAFRHNLN